MKSDPGLFYEKQLAATYRRIAGLDEAGRGALAGPVCVGAAILPVEDARILQRLNGARDSKQLTPLQRERLVPRIRQAALACAVGCASPAEIDALGIAAATRLAALRALEALPLSPDFLLTDFRLDLPELDLPQQALVRGDQISLSVAAASILAKTARDALMRELDSLYPGYGFAKHKGYGSLFHRRAIARLGVSPVHRSSFRLASATEEEAPRGS